MSGEKPLIGRNNSMQSKKDTNICEFLSEEFQASGRGEGEALTTRIEGLPRRGRYFVMTDKRRVIPRVSI